MTIGRASGEHRPRRWPAGPLLLGPLMVWLTWLILALPLSAMAADGVFERGLLFRIQPPGGGPPSHLFGTIHSDDPRVAHVPALVQRWFNRSRALALEVVPNARATTAFAAAMTFDDGRTLSDLLPADVYQASIRALAARGLPEPAVRSFKPWAVTTLLSMPESETGRSLDMVLYRKALAAGMPVVGLETMQEQLAVFEGLSAADQVALLREALTSLPSMPAMFESLIEAYQRRDLAGLMELGGRYSDSADPALAERFRDALIHARNARMAQRVTPMLADGGYFIAVGALHLPGPGGLLNRLAAEGFGVEPLY